MEESERIKKEQRLVDLINFVDECGGGGDIVGWLDSIPEIAELCLCLGLGTGDGKYMEILRLMLDGVDGAVVEMQMDCDISLKEVYGIMRLKISKMHSLIPD